MKTFATVYVMEGANGTIKVGHAVDPKARFRQIPDAISILHATNILEHAELIERTAHRLLALAGKHVRGEWFSATLDEAIEAIERAERIASGAELPLQHSPRDTSDHRVMISLKLPPDLLAAIDAYRKKQPVPPTRTAVIEAATRKLVIDGARKSK